MSRLLTRRLFLDRRELLLGSTAALGLAALPTPLALAAKPAGGWRTDLLARVPQPYRDVIAHTVRLSEADQNALFEFDDDFVLSDLLTRLAGTPAAQGFVFTQIRREPAQRLRLVLIEAVVNAAIAGNGRDPSGPLLEVVKSDTSVDVAFGAVTELERLERSRASSLIAERIVQAEKLGDSRNARLLRARQDEIDFRHIRLPSYAYQAPPVFRVEHELTSDTYRVLVLGDFGTGDSAQKSVAAAMARMHRASRCAFGITLGDNFYSRGIGSPSVPRWAADWDALYGGLELPFYASFGNHDYGDPDSPAAELAHSEGSASWRFPAPFYSFRAASAQFFALDTVRLTDAQLDWLERELRATDAQWKIVFGHHPIYSATRGTNRTEQNLAGRLLPILERNRVDLYLCGHDHNLQELKPEEGLHFFIVGGGGALLYGVRDEYPELLFGTKQHGFGVIEIGERTLTMSLVTDRDQKVRQRVIAKAQQTIWKREG